MGFGVDEDGMQHRKRKIRHNDTGLGWDKYRMGGRGGQEVFWVSAWQLATARVQRRAQPMTAAAVTTSAYHGYAYTHVPVITVVVSFFVFSCACCPRPDWAHVEEPLIALPVRVRVRVPGPGPMHAHSGRRY